jgi:hypothetical protein
LREREREEFLSFLSFSFFFFFREKSLPLREKKNQQDAEAAAARLAGRHRALALGVRRGLLRAGPALRHAGRGVGAGVHGRAGGDAGKEEKNEKISKTKIRQTSSIFDVKHFFLAFELIRMAVFLSILCPRVAPRRRYLRSCAKLKREKSAEQGEAKPLAVLSKQSMERLFAFKKKLN